MSWPATVSVNKATTVPGWSGRLQTSAHYGIMGAVAGTFAVSRQRRSGQWAAASRFRCGCCEPWPSPCRSHGAGHDGGGRPSRRGGHGALSGMAAREMPRRRAERRVMLWQPCSGPVRDERVAGGAVGATGGCDGRRQRPRRRRRRRRRRDRAHRRRRGLCRRCRGAWLVGWRHGVGHWPHRMHTSLVLRRLYFY